MLSNLWQTKLELKFNGFYGQTPWRLNLRIQRSLGQDEQRRARIFRQPTSHGG